MQELELGDVTISAILEHQKPGPLPEVFFPEADGASIRRHRAAMEPFLFDAASGRLILAFQSFLVRTPRSIILVDTCNGPDMTHQGVTWDTQPWLDRFHALGLTFADVDYVLCTHLHIDHTGWNTRLENGRWVPTFPNATYLFERREYAYWQAIATSGVVPPNQRDGIWQANCLPVAEAGQAELVDGNHQLDEFVSLIPSPGHSPGHYCVRIRSGGLEALCLGDAIHHKLQCCEPDWSTSFCWEPRIAAASRRAILHQAAADRTILLPTHFPAPTAGRVHADGKGFRYEFL